MEYAISKADLHNDLLAETLQALSECFGAIGAEVYVVGASARDIALRLLKVEDTPRRTLDLDVAVALKEWSQYDRLSHVMQRNCFEKDKAKQRFTYLGKDGRNRFEVDVVPFGDIEENGLVAWPPEGSPVMSVRGFSDVMAHADGVDVEGAFSFRLASLSGQFLIKLDAWGDRHFRTRKDVADMVYIMQNVYVAYALSSKDMPEEVGMDASNFDVVVAGTEWIAADLKGMLSDANRRYYADMLRKELDKAEESQLINDMLDASDSRNYALFRRALSRMSEILMP